MRVIVAFLAAISFRTVEATGFAKTVRGSFCQLKQTIFMANVLLHI
jgi:hypothetical protein